MTQRCRLSTLSTPREHRRTSPRHCLRARWRRIRSEPRYTRGFAAGAREDRALEVLDRVAQAPELVGDSLIPAGAVLDLLEALCELFGDRADVRTLWHLAPALGLCGVVLERQRRARGRV